MPNALPWYKRRPRDFFEGTVGMPFEEKAAYGLLLDIIYMRGGDLPDDRHYIAGLLGLSTRKWGLIKAKLVAWGKVRVVDGLIVNDVASDDIRSTQSYREQQADNARAKAGNQDEKKRSSADNSEINGASFADNIDEEIAEPNKNSGLPKPSPTEPEPEPELSSSSSRPRDTAEAVDRILAVCGPGCADPAKIPSVSLSATRCYRKWVDAGFDFDLDVLPVIKAQTQNARIKPLTALDVLETDIALHHARRTATVKKKEIENAPGAYPGATGRFTSGSGGGSRSFDVVGVVRDVVEGRGAASGR